MRTLPMSYYIGNSGLYQSAEPDQDLMSDPRGVVWLWDEPKNYHTYVMGCDPTTGITGWNRGNRTDKDYKTDNATIVVFAVDAQVAEMLDNNNQPIIDPATNEPKVYYQDVQVAEFAAPIDAVEIAHVCNILGKLFKGTAEEACELIFESYPGPGVLTLHELVRLGYPNLWNWEKLVNDIGESTSTIGWHSNKESQRALWARSRRHLMLNKAVIRSKWMLEEYANAVVDADKSRARAAYGFHDDRIQAANMCFWAGHRWTYDAEPTELMVTDVAAKEFQLHAPTLDDNVGYKEHWSNLVESWLSD